MGYQTYIMYGYGVQTGLIDAQTSLPQVQELLNLAPNFKKKVIGLIRNEEDPDLRTYLEIPDGFCSGTAFLLQGVIEEAENIRLNICEDCENGWYLLYLPAYPWEKLTEEESKLSEESLGQILGKYVRILVSEPIEINYFHAENGC